MCKGFYVLLCSFWISVSVAQVLPTPIPKFWLNDVHGLGDLDGLNGYSKLSFLKDIHVLTKKNILGRSNTVYVVYKSQEKDSLLLLNFLSVPQQWRIYTNQIITPTEKKITKGNLTTGILLNFSFSNLNEKQSDNYLLINNQYNDNTVLYEVLVYDKKLSPIVKKRTETYLSLKYGISLFDPSRYTAANQKNLWSSNFFPNYDQQIVGVGRSDAFKWYQLKTTHSENTSTTFEIKSDRTDDSKPNEKTVLKDENYILWGHNGKPIVFKEADNGMEWLAREWMVQPTVSGQLTLFTVDIPAVKNDLREVWLYLNRKEADYQGKAVERYLGVRKDSTQLVFEGLKWDTDRSGFDYFTLGRKAKFEFDIKMLPQCYDWNTVDFMIKGGTAPYKVSLKSVDQPEIITILDRDTGTLTDVKSGVYQVEIQEASGETAVRQIKMDKDPAVQISLNKQWTLSTKDHKVLVKPQVINTAGVALKYHWELNGNTVSRSNHLQANTEGKYILTVTDNQGCRKQFETIVVRDNQVVTVSEKWAMYPNPTQAGQPFDIQFDLAGLADVVLYTYTLDGKFIDKRELGKIQQTTVSSVIYQPGVYMLVAIIQGKTELKKIVVQ